MLVMPFIRLDLIEILLLVPLIEHELSSKKYLYLAEKEFWYVTSYLKRTRKLSSNICVISFRNVYKQVEMSIIFLEGWQG